MRLWVSFAVLCALVAPQTSVAVRTIRTSSLRSYGNGAGDVGPVGTSPTINAPAPTEQEQSSKEVTPHKTNAVVTKEFCLQVLKDVATKQPPYFVDNKFTGECRKSLVEQCGDRVCEWAQHYKSAATDCPQCPSSCDAGAQSRAGFFVNFPLQVVSSQHFYMVVQNEMLAHAGSGSGTLPVARSIAAGSGSGVKAPASPTADSPCPKSGCPKTTVTKTFCKQMLQDVIEGKAPYFIEGKFTGESRTGLIAQCSLHICSWARQIQVAGSPKCGASECCLPQSCNVPNEYMQDVSARGQLLAVIKLIGNSNGFNNNLDPNIPPKSIPAQQNPFPSSKLRGPVSVEKVIVGGPDPNDPRDPDFKKSVKEDKSEGDDDEEKATDEEESKESTKDEKEEDEKKKKKKKKKKRKGGGQKVVHKEEGKEEEEVEEIK